MNGPDISARTILQERARQLARPLAQIVDRNFAVTNATSVLVARLGDERASIALDHIIEVYRTPSLTPIPGARTPVVGVIAWRGRVLTVLDIAHSRSGQITITEATRILIIGQRTAAFGIVADEVDDVEDLNTQQAVPVEDVSPARREFVRGVTANALVVLDAAALIARFAPTQHSTGIRE
ncbi:MAG: chemotaxis protein CheW [Gemmatimonadaceae bacterium]